MNVIQPVIRNFDEKKPYIFISYAHSDSKKVFPIITRLQQDGFRVWYDEGIGVGAEWPDTIAKYLEKSTFFLAFLSKAYFKSNNCKDELDLARDLKAEDMSKCLLVYIEEAEMDSGTRLRYGRIQTIKWNAFDIERSFRKLYSTPALEKCNMSGRVPQIFAEPVVPPTPSEKKQKFRSRPKRKISLPQLKKKENSHRRKLPNFIFLIAVLVIIYIIFILCNKNQWEKIFESIRLWKNDMVYLTDVEMADSSGAENSQNVINSLGNTFDKGILLLSWTDPAYVRYYVGDYNYIRGTYSCPETPGDQLQQSYLSIYLDDRTDSPLLEDTISRLTTETSFELDLNGAEYITFQVDPEKAKPDYIAQLLLTDCVLSNKQDTKSLSSVSNKDQKELPVDVPESEELVNLHIVQQNSSSTDVVENEKNSLGNTFDQGVKLFGWGESAYARYYIADYNHISGTYSCPDSYDDDQQCYLTIYLDDQVDHPVLKDTISKTMTETSFELDLEGAEFITFQVDPEKMDVNHTAEALFTNCILSNGKSTKSSSP